MPQTQMQKLNALVGATKYLQKYVLFDTYRIPVAGPDPRFSLFTDGRGRGVVDPYNLSNTKNEISTNMIGDSQVPEGEVVLLTSMYKNYVSRNVVPQLILSSFQDSSGNMWGVPKQFDDNDSIKQDLFAFEGGVGGCAPLVKILRGGNQEKFLELPLFDLPSSTCFSNTGSQEVEDRFSFRERAPLILESKYRFQVDIESLDKVAMPSGEDLLFVVAFEGWRFHPVYGEAGSEEKLRNLIKSLV